MGNEIALYNRMVAAPDPFQAVDKLAQLMTKSGLGNFNKEEQAAIAAIECLHKGISPNDFFRRYDIVQGRIRAKSSSAYADFVRSGGRVKWLNTGEDGQGFAEADFTFDSQTVRYRFTKAMADKQGLIKKDSGWTKFEGNMLRARCLTNGIALLAPGIFAGEDEGEAPQATVTISAPLFPATAGSSVNLTAFDKGLADIKAGRVVDMETALTQAPPIEAEIISVPDPKPELAAETPGENEVPTTAPASNPALIKVELGLDGRIAPNAVKFFIEACRARGNDFENKAVKWLADQKYVDMKNGEPDLFSMSQERLQRIFNNFDKWGSVVEAVK